MAKIEMNLLMLKTCPTSLKDVADRTDLPVDVVKKIVMYGKKVADATAQIKKDLKTADLMTYRRKVMAYYWCKQEQNRKTSQERGKGVTN